MIDEMISTCFFEVKARFSFFDKIRESFHNRAVKFIPLFQENTPLILLKYGELIGVEKQNGG